MAQRRTAPTDAGTFTFWFRRPNAPAPVSAWMLKKEEEEAAFLTTASEAPKVGERLELSEQELLSRRVRGIADQGNPHMPRFGRVIRLDDTQGTTRRVAIRFEQESAE
jgi:hypothetical protein